MLNLFNLIDNQLDALHESLRVVVVQNVHIDTLIAACKECIAVLIGLDAASYRGKNQRSGVDSFEIAARHLQNDRVGCGHDSHELRATFDASAALVCLRLVSWYFKFCWVLTRHIAWLF